MLRLAAICAAVIGVIQGHNSTNRTHANFTSSKNAQRNLYKNLISHLLDDFNIIVPPNAGDPRYPVNFKMEMNIDSISALDMRTQTFIVTIWFHFFWSDELFSWSRSEYPIEYIVLSEKQVWRPVIAVANTLLPRDQLMKSELPVLLSWEGVFHWTPGDTLSLECKIDLRFFPFDEQTCIVRVSQWSETENLVNCTEGSIHSTVSGNGEWDIVRMEVQRFSLKESKFRYWWVDYKITLKRKWFFYAAYVLFPMILVSLLNGLVFILPVESGDKMPVIVTTFLTLAVFLSLVQENLPKNSDTLCYLTLYLSFQLIMGALAFVMAAVQVAYHHRVQGDGRSRSEVSEMTEDCLSGNLDDRQDQDLETTAEEETDDLQCKDRRNQSSNRFSSSSQRFGTRQIFTMMLTLAAICAAVIGVIQGHNSTHRTHANFTSSKNAQRNLYKNLISHLLDDFNIIVPPNAGDPRYPVNFKMKMTIESISALDMRTQTFIVTIWFDIFWNDEFFSWSRSEYPIEYIVLSEKQVWRPVMAVANTLLPRDQLMKSELPVLLSWEGVFHWYPGDTLSLECKIDLRFYPFDEQTCIVRVSQWSETEYLVNCTEGSIRSTVSGNGEWDIVRMEVQRFSSKESKFRYWWVDYKITLKRKWFFYAAYVLFPMILVSLLNGLVFILPVESGDKMPVIVTTFLTLAVFLSLVQENLPKNSDTLCYLTLYLSFQLIMGALAFVMAAVQVAYHHRVQGDGRSRSEVSEMTEDCLSGNLDDRQDQDLETTAEEETDDLQCKDRRNQSSNRFSSSSQRFGTRQIFSIGAGSRCTCNKSGHAASAVAHGPGMTTAEKMDKLVAKIDLACFPVYMVLNVLAFLIYILLVTAP